MTDRQAYQDRKQAELDEWKSEIERMKAKAAKANADARIAWHEQVEALERRQATIQLRLNELEKASGAAWQDVKTGIEETWKTMGDAMKSAASRFS